MVTHIRMQTERVSSFDWHIKIAFGAVCQFVDLLASTVALPTHVVVPVAYPGSESWVLTSHGQDTGVVLKAVPWDTRLKHLHKLTNQPKGISIWCRNELLSATHMQTLWGMLGSVYYPCPVNPLFQVLPDAEVDFQVIAVPLGDAGCDLLSLPGVDVGRIPTRLGERWSDGGMASGVDMVGMLEDRCTASASSADRMLNVRDIDELSAILRAMADRLAGV